MNNSFWTHTAWYIALALTSVISLSTSLCKAREHRKTAAFYLAVLAFTYFLEFGLLASHAYTYQPLLVSEPYFDEVLGNIFSQTSVSASAVLICTLGLSVWWIGGFSVAYYLIDVLFVRVGAYEHFWYQSVFSLVGFFMYALLVRAWHRRIFGTPTRALRRITVFLSAWGLSIHPIATLPKLLGLRVFRTGIFNYAPRDHTWSVCIYLCLLVAFMMAAAAWRVPWRRKAWLLLVPLAAEIGLMVSGGMQTRPGWEPLLVALDLAVSLGVVLLVSAWLAVSDHPAAALRGQPASLWKRVWKGD